MPVLVGKSSSRNATNQKNNIKWNYSYSRIKRTQTKDKLKIEADQ